MSKQTMERDIATHFDDRLRALMNDTVNTCKRMDLSVLTTAAILLSALWSEGIRLAFFAIQDEQIVRNALNETIAKYVANNQKMPALQGRGRSQTR